ncbi:zinc-dependent metalloprotease [Lyngbya sp. CCY1209]|uniref:zinc-dependent metalloprotease n=1 Tax=Lyngbya sp. CCY1209 TaxID=2886103 RepID=UPI002D1FD23B|nr:zinc-dependent metalloprotease [Lyngbya sp. CCY1209]MEB3887384.1 zinc-dependent metalloprotease [Lyngbya sp. CCY1209]
MKKIGLLMGIFALSFLTVTVALPRAIAQVSPPPFRAEMQLAQEPAPAATFADLVEGMERWSGLFTLYQNSQTGSVYLEIRPEQFEEPFLCFITLDAGLETVGTFGGLDLGDFLFQLRPRSNSVEFVIPNINFRAAPDDPQWRSLARSAGESILYTLPILAVHPDRQSVLVDLGTVLTGDRELSGLSDRLIAALQNNYSLDAQKSYISSVEAFPNNVEIESVLGFSGGGNLPFWDSPALPDSRSFNLRIRYSFLAVPDPNGYRPRIADERIGYFTTTYQDVSDPNRGRRSSVVRHINRWNLQKRDPAAPLSPPVEPIVFWIENTVPSEYRDAIREGVLMWNEAFEAAGFSDAIEVRQMPDDAPWDPADVRYNTIRWSMSFDARFSGYGPSHVNPLTGEILDADMVIESRAIADLGSGKAVLADLNTDVCEVGLSANRRELDEHRCFAAGSERQLAVGAIALSTLDPKTHTDSVEEYIHQFLRLLVAHEIGHALGLRHNFHGSTMLAPEELNDKNITRTRGMVASVMDYVPVNLAPRGQPQGDYFPAIVGPYDRWAIEYGYKPISAGTPYGESRELQEIARRGTAPELAFATDEDLWGVYLDPAANAFDLSNDMLQYSRSQLDNARAMWERLETRSFGWGGESDQLRQVFETIFGYYFSQVDNATVYVGGQSFDRQRVGSRGGTLPLEPIPASEQRRALRLLEEYVFAEDAFNFSPDLINRLVPSRWSDWGNPDRYASLDYPIGDRILWLQTYVLRELLAPTRLSRLRDLELKTAPGNTLTLPELFEMLNNSIWTEIWRDDGVAIGGFRRPLQQVYLDILADMVLENTDVPEDAKTLAWFQLKQLGEAISHRLDKGGDRMDAYTLAHLEKSRDRIFKTLDARLQVND